MNLVLFTNYFPYKKSEPFLENEFLYTRQHTKTIKLFSLYGLSSDSKLQATDTLQLYTPVHQSASHKIKLFTKGFFNRAPFGHHLFEFFSKKIFLSPSKTYWHLVSLLVTRSVLSSPSYKKLVEDLKLVDSPVLYFYWGDNLCWILPYLKNDLGAKKYKVVLRLHGSDVYESIKADYAPLRPLIFEMANSIYTVSQNGKDYLTQRYPIFKDKLKVARLGVADFGLNVNSSAQKVVLSVSNLIPLKRIHLIFEALQAITDKVTWYHFGTGPLLNELEALIKNTRPDLEIKLMGQVKHSDLMNFYKTHAVSVFVNVSSSEGLPVSIMEAFSFGVPAIATNVGGTSELVNSQTGYLLDKNFNLEQLSKTLTDYLNLDESSSLEYRKQARLAFEDTVSLKNYEVFYKDIESL
jgi:colanic acid/amylovoran biosynthesis glycosyltransferase